MDRWNVGQMGCGLRGSRCGGWSVMIQGRMSWMLVSGQVGFEVRIGIADLLENSDFAIERTNIGWVV